MSAERQLDALSALCDTIIAGIKTEGEAKAYWERPASALQIADKIMELMENAKAEDRDQFGQLLQLISNPMLGITWLGPLKPAHKLSPKQRETLLRRWANSPISSVRNGFNALKKLTGLLYFGSVPEGETENPNWKDLDYQPLMAHILTDPAPLPSLSIKDANTLDCDVLVIGSGSGGSIMAAQLAAAGKEVIVVEKGGYTQAHEFTQQEAPMIQKHFEAGGLLTTQDGSVTLFAGSTLGGGGTINWAGSLRTPDYILEEWAKQHGNPHFLEADYRAGFDVVEKRNHVNSDLLHNPQNQALMDAASALQYKVENIPLNMRLPDELPQAFAWKAAGFSCYGDAYNIKQGPVQTFLRDAVFHWAKLLPNAKAEKIIIEYGAARGAEVTVTDPQSGEKRLIRIRAKKVVLSAGALHTPTLLLKSGLRHPHIGQHLHLHPVATVAGFYQKEMRPWYGPMMSVVVQEFAQLDGNWGTRLECPPIHPGLAAFALGWENARQFKQDLLDIKHLAVFFSLVRDRHAGKVSVGKKSGEPIVQYQLHPYDRAHLLRGLQECARLHQAAGAERIMVPHNRPLRFAGKSDLASALRQMTKRNWGPNHFGVFSAHQMGTCRMGGNDKDYPVKPNGETRETKDLFVADTSLFPSASGTNPMLSVQALALHVAKGML